jgi:hypothetical protein
MLLYTYPYFPPQSVPFIKNHLPVPSSSLQDTHGKQLTCCNDVGSHYGPDDTPAVSTGLQQCEIHWYAG